MKTNIVEKPVPAWLRVISGHVDVVAKVGSVVLETGAHLTELHPWFIALGSRGRSSSRGGALFLILGSYCSYGGLEWFEKIFVKIGVNCMHV